MKIEYYSAEKLKKDIIAILSKYPDLSQYKVFFFGSRVKGNNFPSADIDIGIEGSQEIPTEIKLAIQEQIDNLPTLYKFDVVDFKVASEKFKKEALKHKEYVR
ncbi:nucleotidyltransferase domain-containing protein [Patescibacteria group bacterium]|nr:nucleotidyltransferase domain-containing protein [Patescibacteria group bacterium]